MGLQTSAIETEVYPCVRCEMSPVLDLELGKLDKSANAMLVGGSDVCTE